MWFLILCLFFPSIRFLFLFFFSLVFCPPHTYTHRIPSSPFFFYTFYLIPEPPSLFLSLALSFFLLFLFLLDSRTLSSSISHKQILSHTRIDHQQRSGDRHFTQIGILHFFFFFVLVWLVLFYCLDFIRLMRKIVFVFQIFQLGFVFLFWLWYVLVCNRWDREAWESEERKRKGMREKELFFYSTGYYFKGEYCLEVLQ